MLAPYVKARRAVVEKVPFFISVPSETQYAREGGQFRGVALHYARLAALSGTPSWLLVIDDDEFVLPWRSAAPLCSYLASDEASRYAMVRFLWRKVRAPVF